MRVSRPAGRATLSYALAVGVTACSRGPTASSRPASSSSTPLAVPSVAGSLLGEPRIRSESEALARIRELPEVAHLLEAKQDVDAVERVVRVVSSPNLSSSQALGPGIWELMVAERADVDADGGLSGGREPIVSIRLDPYTEKLSLRAMGQTRFLDYTAWRELRHAQEAATACILSIPEWKPRAAITKRDAGSELGLICDQESSPRDCSPRAGNCRIVCEAIRTCDASCAGGRWAQFEVDLGQGTLSVQDEASSAMMAYGQWRNRFRAAVSKSGEPAYRFLIAPQLAFPDYQPGRGDFGYGRPNETSTVAPEALRRLFEDAGYRLLSRETYGHAGFKLFVVAALTPARGGQDDGELRKLGAALVRANGQRTCELVVRGSSQRFQFDRFALDAGNGGFYTFVNGAFHPALARSVTP